MSTGAPAFVFGGGPAERLARPLQRAEGDDVAREEHGDGPVERDPHAAVERGHLGEVVRAVEPPRRKAAHPDAAGESGDAPVAAERHELAAVVIAERAWR